MVHVRCGAAKQESEAGEDIRKLRQAQRDLAAAQTRVKALTSELEEVRARVEADRLQNDSAQRALQRQSSEQSSSVKQLMVRVRVRGARVHLYCTVLELVLFSVH